MIFGRIWERYFLKQLSTVFILFILCFYGLYILIDYSSRGNTFRALHFSFFDLAVYYFYLFIQRLDILIPFAFLIACIRTLCLLNVRNELIALLASGIPLKTLMRPFLAMALSLTTLLYINHQFLLPYAWKSLRHLEDSHFEEKNPGVRKEGVQHVMLADGTLILFHTYDSARDIFFDAYWIRSIDDIYHMKLLHPYNTPPEGQFVDHFVRQKGKLLLKESQTKGYFPEMKFDRKALTESLALPQEQSLTQLWRQLPSFGQSLNDRDAQILSAFYYKLAMPWLCLLVFIAPAPFCLRFSRQLHVFMIYLCSMFGTVAVYLIMNTALVMAENQVISPFVAIIVPMGTFLAFFGWLYQRRS